MDIKISEITPQQVQELWPPPMPQAPSAVELEDMKVRRPHLRLRFGLNGAVAVRWLQHEDQDFVGTEDVGRFVKLTRNDLLENLPEGARWEFPLRFRRFWWMFQAVGMLRRLWRAGARPDSDPQPHPPRGGRLL